ncbi:hypothetical protein BCR44DRAFT_1445940, partial [Catenaria anguillulae PL171]
CLLRRQMIQYEYTCASNWEKNWAFMKNRLPRSNKSNLSSKDSLPPISHNALCVSHSSTPDTSEPLWATLLRTNVRHIDSSPPTTGKYSFPATTAEMYGWQFGDKEKKSTSIQVLDRFAG